EMSCRLDRFASLAAAGASGRARRARSGSEPLHSLRMTGALGAGWADTGSAPTGCERWMTGKGRPIRHDRGRPRGTTLWRGCAGPVVWGAARRLVQDEVRDRLTLSRTGVDVVRWS